MRSGLQRKGRKGLSGRDGPSAATSADGALALIDDATLRQHSRPIHVRIPPSVLAEAPARRGGWLLRRHRARPLGRTGWIRQHYSRCCSFLATPGRSFLFHLARIAALTEVVLTLRRAVTGAQPPAG